MKRITVSFILTAAVLCAAHAEFSGNGLGTEAEPYQVATADQLNEVRNDLSSHFILMNDIDLASYANWTPIGTFTGVFDGDGHVITNLNVETNAANAGLFSIVTGKIRNLGVKGNLTATAASGYGLIAGCLGQSGAPGEITNCYAEGTVSCTGTGTVNTGVGVLLGALTRGSKIAGCYSKGSVDAPGRQYVGGLVGRMTHKECFISDCYSEANVAGAKNIGGIIGRIYSATTVNASNLYATGSVSGDEWVGGIAGDLYNGQATGLIAANSSVTATTANVARVAPNANGTPALEYIYGLNTTEVKLGEAEHTIVSDIAGVDGLTIESTELNEAFYTAAGWDMESIWKLETGSTLPVLRKEGDITVNVKKAQAGVPFTVYMQGRLLHVANIDAGDNIAVYNTNGQLIKQQESAGTTDVLILQQPGLYMVKVAGTQGTKAVKIVCK